eukprot:8776460-Alexandrium_andersonii.AAC.1
MPAPHGRARECAVQLVVELGPAQASGARGVGQHRPAVAGDDHLVPRRGELLSEAKGQCQGCGLHI